MEGGEEGDDTSGPPGGNESAWVAVERITDLAGPSFFYQYVQQEDGESSRPYCIALNPALHRVEAHLVRPTVIDERIAANLDLDGAEIVHDAIGDNLLTPSEVTQVWVATRVLDTPSTAPRYSLRSSEGRFMSSSKEGLVSATSEARGPLEELTLAAAGAGTTSSFYVKTAHSTLLGLDMVAGGKMVVKSDFDFDKDHGQAASPSETWKIAVQWKYREAARKKEEGEKPLRERDTSFKRVKPV